MMYHYISRSKFVETLKVIWIQYNANIIAFEHVFRWGLNKRIQTYGNPM